MVGSLGNAKKVWNEGKPLIKSPKQKDQLLTFSCGGSFQIIFLMMIALFLYKSRIMHFTPCGDFFFFYSAYHKYFSFFEKCSFLMVRLLLCMCVCCFEVGNSCFVFKRAFWVKVAQSRPTLCNPLEYTVHGILQARILEWIAFPFSKGSS